MKILSVTYHNPHFITFAEYVERALSQLGHTIQSFDYRQWLIPGRVRDRVPALQAFDLKRINNKLIGSAKTFRPDIVLVNGGYTIAPETITRIKKEIKSIMVNWIADFPLMFNEYAHAGPYYDFCFWGGTDALHRYKSLGGSNGHWLPYACDPFYHKPVALSDADKKKYKCDICFVGSNYSERVAILEKLCCFDIGIWGLGWERLPAKSPLVRRLRGGAIGPEIWTKIFSAAKIVLNITGHRANVMVPFIDEKDFRNTNTRVFEILGCGAFQLVDVKADVLALFKRGEHLDCYKDKQEAVEQADFYLRNPEKRNAIAEEGRKEALKKHTYKHRIEEMMSVILRKI
jgi:Uncharacterized protein conserved in bacteria